MKTEVIEPHGLTVAAAAKVLGVSRPALSTLPNGRSDLAGIMALRIIVFKALYRDWGIKRPKSEYEGTI